tara:strand:+ start:228 stop:986 length:759 start_codon:yes stop_codon:yes gene_type:complete
MLRPRIIPCLLIDGEDVIKTVNFKDGTYIGDPLNIVRLFNEKKSDEIIIIDISASRLKKNPNYVLIENIAEESRMPVAYGGGIKTAEQALRIFNSGIEKISVSSLFFENKLEINKIVKSVGSQSLVITLDIKRFKNKYSIFTNNGDKFVTNNIVDVIKEVQDLNFGEIILNNIDKDGTMSGYDNDLIKLIYENSLIPLTVLGGVGKREHLVESINKFGSIGYACGSYFIFKGPRKAVLISYDNNFNLNFDKY